MSYVVLVADVSAGPGYFRKYFIPKTVEGGYVFRLTRHTQRFSTREEAQYAVWRWRCGGAAVHRKYTIHTEEEAKALVALAALAEIE